MSSQELERQLEAARQAAEETMARLTAEVVAASVRLESGEVGTELRNTLGGGKMQESGNAEGAGKWNAEGVGKRKCGRHRKAEMRKEQKCGKHGKAEKRKSGM